MTTKEVRVGDKVRRVESLGSSESNAVSVTMGTQVSGTIEQVKAIYFMAVTWRKTV